MIRAWVSAKRGLLLFAIAVLFVGDLLALDDIATVGDPVFVLTYLLLIGSGILFGYVAAKFFLSRNPHTRGQNGFNGVGL